LSASVDNIGFLENILRLQNVAMECVYIHEFDTIQINFMKQKISELIP